MAIVNNPLQTFIWGEGGAALTPEQIASRRKVENALLAKGVDTSPVGHWSQGAARVADALVGAVRRGQLDKADAESTALAGSQFSSAMEALRGSQSTPPASTSSPIPMTSAAGEVSATSPVTGDTYAPFMDAVKAGGLTNPYGLAAVAATGRAESGWSAANANRTWSDPSESGQPGTAGGIMSWRGPRYQALAATGDLSPTGQANFFLNEDPALIQKLNNAKSLEEAQQLMNNAWAFAGYNRPGGESARRFGYAQGYLPTFQGGNQVASLDPAAGMGASQAIDAAATPSGYVDPGIAAQPEQPAFDMGRFGPNINLAEMPPTRADIAPQIQQQTMALTPPAASPAPTPVQEITQQVVQAAPPSQANPFMNEAVLKALSSPYMNEGQRAVISALIQQQEAQRQAQLEESTWRNRQLWSQEQQRANPSYQLEQDLKRAQLDATRAKPTKQWQKLDDTTLFNPETGETKSVGAAPTGSGQFRFEGKSVEAQALNGLMEAGQLTSGQAQQLGAGKTITGPNGEIIFLTPQGVFGRNADGKTTTLSAPDTAPSDGVDIFGGQPATAAPQPAQTPDPRQGMITLTEPRVTIDESKAGGFADRMTESGLLVDKFGKAGLNAFDQAITNSPYVPGFVANNLVGDDFQQYDQARRDFINAQLRRESGAVISDEEFDNANKQYFPQPGDKPEVLKQKARNRETVINAMIRDAGPTYKRKAADTGGGDVAKPTTDEEYNALPSGALFIDPDDGKQYRKP